MKHIFAYTLSFVAIAAAALMFTKASRAEDDPETPEILNRYKAEGGVSTAKEVSSQNEDGSYTITLETFATGTSTVVMSSVPSDIVLVLDVSSSMDQSDYTYKGQSMRRWRALRAAVLDFVQTIYDNAVTTRASDPDYAGNRIAIVTYCRNARLITNGWMDIEQVVSKNGNTYSGQLIDIINTNNTNGVWASDNNATATRGTRPDHGFEMTIDQLLDGDPTKAREDANLTVVMFTDGYPTDSNATNEGQPNGQSSSAKFEPPIANKTLYYGSRIKKDYGAKLFTVGLITSVTRANNWQWANYCRVLQMMDWLSSNYPDADWAEGAVDESKMYIESEGSNHNHYNGYTGTDNVYQGNNIPDPWRNAWDFTYNTNSVSLNQFNAGQTETDGDKFTTDGEYCKIVDDNTSFDSIFQAIADASGGAAAEIGASTQVRDVVSSSFVLPEGTASDLSKINLKITSYDIKSDVSDWYNAKQLYPVSSGTPTVTPSIVTTEDGHEALYVEGFDYSKDDEPENSGNGNWVGVRYDSQGHPYYAGKKLVIQFDIFVNDDATGGQGTATNTSDSGVYVLQDDGSYKNINSYEVPHTTVPVNIIIQKTGLRHGEGATFEIHRAEILRDDNGNVVYNALGKPKPNEGTWDENFSKVIVTNKGTNGAAVTKTLLALDPAYVYRVAEDKWGWAYEMTGQGGTLTTAEVEVNPFKFTNEELSDKPKHAEAVTINHFSTPTQGSYEEHYKSSKVESF